MNRRRWLGSALGLLAVAPCSLAHTPYRQWQVYRQKHLLIGCHRQDPAGYALAKRVVAVLEQQLPNARARVARGPTAGRLASLLGTEQMEVVLLDSEEVAAMSAGHGAFAPYGDIPLRALARLDDHWLVAHADFPERHARLVTQALRSERSFADTGGQPPPVAWHPGSLDSHEHRR